MLQVDHLGVDFPTRGGEFRALDGVSVVVPEGQFISIVGRSGCGKSTLFNAVAGLIPPTRGDIRYRGRDVGGRPGHAGYMLQQDLLFAWRRLIDNVALGGDVLGRKRRESRQRAASCSLDSASIGSSGRTRPSSPAGCANEPPCSERSCSIATCCY